MSHPNDMTQWDEIACKRGCDEHPTRDIHVDFSIPHGYKDLPRIPRQFRGINFDFTVWDTDKTPVDGGPYCPARDAVSETILSHGVWEPMETIVMLDLFDRCPDSLFVDIGAQIGWFSTLALQMGVHPFLVETDLDTLGVAAENVKRHWPAPVQDIDGIDLPFFWGCTNARVGHEETCEHDYGGLPLWPEPAWHERTSGQVLAKIDVEGAEPEAVELLDFWFGLKNVSFMLIEISPVFHDRYEEMVRRIMEAGFIAATFPPKHRPPHRLETIEDLDWWFHTDAFIDNEIIDAHQLNALFIRDTLL